MNDGKVRTGVNRGMAERTMFQLASIITTTWETILSILLGKIIEQLDARAWIPDERPTCRRKSELEI